MKTSRSTAMRAILCLVLVLTALLSQPVTAGPAEVSLSGRLIVGIAEADPPTSSSPLYTLEAEDGRTIRLFLADEATLPAEGLDTLHGRSVTVTGRWTEAYLQGQGSPALMVQSLLIAETGEVRASEVHISDITGSKPWVWILCKFSGDADQPVTPAQVAAQAAGLDPYFQEASYNKANITGSYVVTQWYTLPQPKSYYVYDMDSNGSVDLDTSRAAADCTALADATVNFTNYYGLNLMFNDPLTAAGLTTWVSLTRDGVTKSWPSVFIGDDDTGWLDNMELNAHEMYHGFGLSHSAVRNADGTVKTGNQWDPVGIGACGFSSCTALHPPAPQKAELGWIAADKTYTATLATQTVDLEALAQPQTANYLMVKIPLEDQHFYTLEARRPVGYDSKVPGPGVLIHEVNTRSGAFSNGHIGIIPAIASAFSAGENARWTVGRGPFVDSTFGVTVTVVTTLTTGFRVKIEVAPIQTAVLYVKANAAGANNGTSWTNAYTDLQDALAAANPTGKNRVEIWVAQGIYKPTEGTDRTVAFGMKNNVRIYGGFNGTETARSQRDIAAYPTLLSGDLLGNDTATIAPDEPTRSENSYHVITDTANTVGLLDGVTVLGGNANGEDDPLNQGGGMYSHSGSSILRHVTFKNNTASNSGGGVAASYSTLRLVNTTFIGNVSRWGGGMYLYSSAPSLNQVIFSGNSATYRGGGLCNVFSNVKLVNTTFSNNLATYYSNAAGGGLFNYGSSNNPGAATIANSIFWGNTDRVNGSGTTAAQLGDNGYETFNVSYSLVQGSSVYTGTGNINGNPLFVDANGADNIYGTADDNLHLQRSSPAIDAGNNSAVATDVGDLDHDEDTSEQTPYDMEGKTRIMSPFDADPLLVDMGPYEFPSVSVYLPTVMRNQ